MLELVEPLLSRKTANWQEPVEPRLRLILFLVWVFHHVCTGTAFQETMDGFAERGYPICAGAIDGMHIPIIVPHEDLQAYYDQKGWNTIVLQAVVDHNYK